MWLFQPSRGEEKEGGPDINIQGTWARTVTGVLAIMNTFKLLQLWEKGQQLENVFTVTNFLHQIWAVRVVSLVFLSTIKWGELMVKATHNNTLNTNYMCHADLLACVFVNTSEYFLKTWICSSGTIHWKNLLSSFCSRMLQLDQERLRSKRNVLNVDKWAQEPSKRFEIEKMKNLNLDVLKCIESFDPWLLVNGFAQRRDKAGEFIKFIKLLTI